MVEGCQDDVLQLPLTTAKLRPAAVHPVENKISRRDKGR